MSKGYAFQKEYIDMLAMRVQTFPVHSKETLIMVADFVNTAKFKGINNFHIRGK